MPTKTPRDVVLASFNYLSEIAPPTQKISDVRVEEVKTYKDHESIEYWTVVLSYENVSDFPFNKVREYKRFNVEDVGGKVLSMESFQK